MLSEFDQSNPLDEQIFSYRISKDQKVFISWYGKQVTVLKGKQADKFIAKINRADEQERQLIMAKITGNFKRGNEK